MMNRMTQYIAVCLGMLLGGAGFVAAQDQPTVLVAPLKGDAKQVPDWQPALGSGLAEMFITEISKRNKFQVLESTHTDDLINEIKMGEEGYVDKSEATTKGGFAGADYLFVGTVTRFGSKKQEVGATGFSVGGIGVSDVGVTKADVRIDWRLTDVATRKIVKTGSAVGQETGVSFDVSASVDSNGGGIGYKNSEFMGSALGKATVKAINAIMTDMDAYTPPPVSGRRKQLDNAAAKEVHLAQAVTQAQTEERKKISGKVLAVVGRNIVIASLGSSQGIKAGSRLKLCQPLEIKDEKGEVVFTEEKDVGELEVEAVQEDRCKATFRGTAEVKSGWVVHPF